MAADPRTVVGWLAAAVLVAGCGDPSAESGAAGPKADGPCGLTLLDRPAEVVTQPEVPEASQSESNLTLELSSASVEAVRVRVRFDGKLALDVRTPGVPHQCADEPVYSYEYQLPGDQVRVTTTTDQGQRRSTNVPLDDSKHWVVVQPQDGFPLGLHVFDEEVSWG